MAKTSQHINLNITQHQALIGSLLGDGHLAKRSGNVRFKVDRSAKDGQYLQYEANIFSNLLAPAYINGIKYVSRIDKRSNNIHYKCLFTTITNSIFTEYHNKWYKEINGKFVKIVPLDLELSPLIMAHWFADDGSITQSSQPHRLIITFHTQGFTKKEVEFLVGLLSDRYNEYFSIYKHRNHYTISAADSASRAIIKDIDSVFVMQRKRLWDKPEVCYYSNQPVRSVSSRIGLLDRKAKLEHIINTETSISMFNLAVKLNYWVPDRNHPKDKLKNLPNYFLINKLIKPYLDKKIMVKEKGLDNLTVIKINNQVDDYY